MKLKDSAQQNNGHQIEEAVKKMRENFCML
jgi:hypothetical protein